MAAARGAHDEVEQRAAEALARSARARPKYEVATLVTRARSRADRGRRVEALSDLDGALAIARVSRDPALFLRAAVPRCALDGSDELAAEISATEQRIELSR